MSINTNLVFVRHGFGCHNAIRPLRQAGVITQDTSLNSLNIHSDPELTPLGVDASIHNGYVIKKLAKHAHLHTGDNNMKVSKIHVVGCSPLIRSMESAYYMTRKWKKPPKKIFVFPFLREIDEASNDKYSPTSRKVIDSSPSYSMKSIEQQKKHLKKYGLLRYFDFSFVENDAIGRQEPGDVIKFTEWFNTKYVNSLKKPEPNLNVFVVSHSGVLWDFSHQSFHNNSGFLLNVSLKGAKVKYNKIYTFDKHLPREFFSDYSNPIYATANYYCPSNRCGDLCTSTPSNSLQHLVSNYHSESES
jgi:broad specificity phosphatase PhoE